MTTPRDPDSILATWLEVGPTRLPATARQAILASIRISRQDRHPRWMPWRTTMPTFMQAAAAIAVIIVGYIGLNLAVTNPAPGSVAGTIDTSSWATYVSDRYGFSIGYPEDWAIEHQSEEDWAMDGGTEQRGFETFSGTGDDMATIGVSAWSAAVDPGIAADSWIANYCWLHASSCTAIEERSEPVTMDGHAGTLVSFDTPQAFVLVDDQMYVVAVWRPESDPSVESYGGATQLLKGFLSTMELLP